MVEFCGQDTCLIDANGRVKLSPRFLADFRRIGDEVVLHALGEGALGVYPVPVWLQMRQCEPRPAAKASRSVVFRRELRRFGAFTQQERLSNQGRITIPTHFRDSLELQPGTDAVLVGCEIGIEIWNAERWKHEYELLQEHQRRKSEAEMAADLAAPATDDA